jgi:hypothetical protein
MQGVCKLCLNEKKLRNSHILPEFFYDNLYDPNPRKYYLLRLNLDEPKDFGKRTEQKGIREYLLCDECEGKLAKNEKYAAETFYAKNKMSGVFLTEESFIEGTKDSILIFQGYKYKEFKLFLMSLLWRIIISKSFETPSDIDPEYIENLRLALYNQDPLEVNEYSCLLHVLFYDQNKPARNFILNPYITKTPDIERNLNILIDGVLFSFSLQRNLNYSSRFLLQKNGAMGYWKRFVSDDKILTETLSKVYEKFSEGFKL